MAKGINQQRRRFLGVAAMTLAAAQLGKIGSAHEQLSKTTPAALPTIQQGANSSFGALKQIDAGLLNFGYAEAGPANGAAVILLHGWPYDIHSYVDVAPLLASKGYRVIVPYLRGYGTTRFLSNETLRNGQQLPIAVVFKATASRQADGEAAPIYGIKIPLGYRDWRMISAAQVGAPVNDLRVKLGNDIAIKAYREVKLPFPDGTIIARLAYSQVTSEENNKVFRAAAEQRGLPPEQIEKLLAASSVAGPATNIQFMVKDSKKYASTGGWGFAQFTNGKPDGEAVHKTCFACHTPAKDRDFVFTRYSP